MRIGPYEVLGELGRGGMGTVYRVREADGREAALKLFAGGSEDPEKVAAFEREVRLLRSFTRAEGFVAVIDVGSERGWRYLVMPFLEGGTLRQRLKAGKLDVVEAVTLVATVAEAMGSAHEKGVVHRDLKPENVLFDGEGRPLVADLGLAKHFRRDVLGASKSGAMSETGVIAGTPGYMAPEQLEDSKRAQPQADVFALGAILHEALTGKRPFEGNGLLGYTEALLSDPLPPSKLRAGVPAWLDEVVRRALARKEEERFVDARALARALRAGAAGASARRRVAIVLGGFVVAVFLGAAAYRIATSSRQPAPITPPRAPPAPPPRAPSAVELAERAEKKVGTGGEDEAVALASRAIQLEPSLARAWAVRGEARYLRGDSAGARADLERAIELGSESARAWCLRGLMRLDDDPSGAIDDATRAIELDPNQVRAWSLRGRARFRMGQGNDVVAGMRDLTRSIELAPGLATVWLDRALARGMIRDFEGEVSDAGRAIELDPSVPEAWELRAKGREETGNVDGAIADLSRELEIAPQLAEGWGHRGMLFARRGDLERAMAGLSRAIEIDPRLGPAYLCRGSVKQDRGDLPGALDDMSKAIELDPRHGEAWMRRGDLRLRMGDAAGAVADLGRALELAPDQAIAALLRNKLEEARKKVR